MPEATIICCDCSEYMRNGDFHPTRFDAQSDSVGLIANAKTQQNHENTVGLIAMHPNAKADVLVNCTQDIGRVLSSLAKMKIGDNSLIKPPTLASTSSSSTAAAADTSKKRDDDDNECDSINVLVALQTAQLALKHRKNKKQDQRIILFVGSPVVKAQNEKALIKAAKRLKKNNVSVDIVNFGESEDNTGILERFISAVKTNDNSNLVTVEGGKMLSDVLIATPIFSQSGQQISEFGGMGGDADLNAAIRASQENGGAGGGDASGAAAGGAGAGAGAGAAGFGGVDPNMDPELAMALRLSMEEERQRQEQEAKKAADDAGGAAAAGGDNAVASVPVASGDGDANADGNNNTAEQKANDEAENTKAAVGGDLSAMAEEIGIDEDDEELLAALQMSMEENADNADGGDDVDMADAQNENVRDELLEALPGITADDIGDIDGMLEALGADEEEEDNNNNAQNKDKKKDDKDQNKK